MRNGKQVSQVTGTAPHLCRKAHTHIHTVTDTGEETGK